MGILEINVRFKKWSVLNGLLVGACKEIIFARFNQRHISKNPGR